MVNEPARKWWLLVAVSCVLGLVLLDETVVGVALPTMAEDLKLTSIQSHWVVNSYLLVFACLVAAGGKLGDQYGMLPAFLAGLAVFGLCSVAAGFAGSGSVLISARALQGLGAAIVFPLYLAMITMTFPTEQRGFALGISGAIGTMFLSAGPLVGGLLTEHLSWRWIFWINPPIVIVIASVTALVWRDVPRRKSPPVDWPGLTLIASGMLGLVFGLMQSAVWGLSSPTVFLPLVAGIVLLMVFVRQELRRSAPLIEVDLFRNPAFAASSAATFMAQYAKMPIFIFAAMYAQEVLHLSPAMAGALVMLSAVPQVVLAPVCGRLVNRHSLGKLLVAGLMGTGTALAWMALTSPSANVWLFAPGLLIAGIAFPFQFVPARAAIMASLPPSKHGQGGGITMTSQMLGGTFGLAVSSLLFLTHEAFLAVFGAASLLLFVVAAASSLAFRKERLHRDHD